MHGALKEAESGEGDRITCRRGGGLGQGQAGESWVRTQRWRRGDRRTDKGPGGWPTAEEGTVDRLFRDIHIEYKNNRHLSTNN